KLRSHPAAFKSGTRLRAMSSGTPMALTAAAPSQTSDASAAAARPAKTILFDLSSYRLRNGP
ncbi:hypothetical protein, partial [Methylorubrum suomiense]|uniref:hypothetical protein n=1 Tax=Methylorubrum suomiense TaxID=144191 RepID=UPI003639FF69